MEVYTPDIIHGVLNNDLNEIKQALQNDPTCINNQDENGFSPAMLAAKCENLELLKFLVVQEGFDREVASYEDELQLFDCYCFTDNDEIIVFAQGVYEPSLEEEIEAIWEDARFKENLVRQRFSLMDVKTPNIIKGVLSGDFNQVLYELRKDPASVNTQDEKGNTPAIHAAKLNDLEMLEFLSSEDIFECYKCDNGGNHLMSIAEGFGASDLYILVLDLYTEKAGKTQVPLNKLKPSFSILKL